MVTEGPSKQGTRSPIELLWTAKNKCVVLEAVVEKGFDQHVPLKAGLDVLNLISYLLTWPTYELTPWYIFCLLFCTFFSHSLLVLQAYYDAKLFFSAKTHFLVCQSAPPNQGCTFHTRMGRLYRSVWMGKMGMGKMDFIEE